MGTSMADLTEDLCSWPSLPWIHSPVRGPQQDILCNWTSLFAMCLSLDKIPNARVKRFVPRTFLWCPNVVVQLLPFSVVHSDHHTRRKTGRIRKSVDRYVSKNSFSLNLLSYLITDYVIYFRSDDERRGRAKVLWTFPVSIDHRGTSKKENWAKKWKKVHPEKKVIYNRFGAQIIWLLRVCCYIILSVDERTENC